MTATIDSAGFHRLSPADVAAKVAAGADIYIIDLREPRQYQAGHIEDSILLPAGDFADRFDREVDPEDEVILVCEKGQTSEAAANFLISQGFTNVATMTGGMLAWNAEKAA